MTKLTKQHFVDQNRPRGLDVADLSTDGALTGALQAAGQGAAALAAADLDGDGRISKKGELAALFEAVDAFDTSGAGAGAIHTATPAGPTREGRVLNALGVLLQNNLPAPGLSALSASVGAGGANNTADVRLVQTRLAELGFDVGVDGQWGPNSQRGLNAFDAMLHNRNHAQATRIDVGGALLRALAHNDAPGWVEMPLQGTGFINGDLDHHDYGSTLTRDTIIAVGARYHADHLAANPNARPITTNDVSVRPGGHTPDHATHEGGLDIDVRLPRNDGTNGGAKVSWGTYDRDATRAMVIAFAKDDSVERVLTGDATLVAEFAASTETWARKVADGGSSHSDHLHIDLAPPTL